MHVLMHVPCDQQRRFKTVVKGCCGGTDEIDVRPCDYRTKTNHKGGQSNMMTYVTQNSPQAERFWRRMTLEGQRLSANVRSDRASAISAT
jgi:hypothetical protein